MSAGHGRVNKAVDHFVDPFAHGLGCGKDGFVAERRGPLRREIDQVCPDKVNRLGGAVRERDGKPVKSPVKFLPSPGRQRPGLGQA